MFLKVGSRDPQGVFEGVPGVPLYIWGTLGTKSYKMGLCGLICVSSDVLDVKKFEKH